MTSLVHNPNVNDTRLTDLMSEVRELGRESAEGKDALPKLALRVARAAEDGVLTLDKDKDGVDDAARVYSEYARSESKKSIHDHTSTGLKANVSKLRSIIKATVGNPARDFVDVLNRAHIARQAMITADEKVRPAYQAFVECARQQIEHNDSDLTEEQIKGCVLRPAPKDRELEAELEAIQKKLADLISGDGRHGLKDQSQQLIDAHALVSERLAALLRKQDEDAALAKLRELGYDIEVGQPEVTHEVTEETAVEAADLEPAEATVTDEQIVEAFAA